MNLRQLRTLATFLDKGSFSAVGDEIGLSHSAVSIQVRELESELNVTLFDRSAKPPLFTPMGKQVALISREVLEKVAAIHRVAAGEHIPGSIAIGVVPTTLQYLLPTLLDALRQHYPLLQVTVRSGFSGELATAVSCGTMDIAIATSPVGRIDGLALTEIATEPLRVIGPADSDGINDDAALVRALPFIAFSKKTWLGQQIDARLQARGIHVNEVMEVDSLDAIEPLVAAGFGVSIVPQRVLAPPLAARLHCLPFGNPEEMRRLVLIQNSNRTEQVFDKSLQSIIGDLLASNTPAKRK